MIIRKLTAATLLLYVLVLLTQPCQDVFARSYEPGREGKLIVAAEAPADPESESETCSPFCICSCCSLSVVSCDITFAAVPEATSSLTGNLATNYDSPYAKRFRASIWQPPKV